MELYLALTFLIFLLAAYKAEQADKDLEVSFLKQRVKSAASTEFNRGSHHGYQQGYLDGSDIEAARWMDVEKEAYDCGFHDGREASADEILDLKTELLKCDITKCASSPNKS